MDQQELAQELASFALTPHAPPVGEETQNWRQEASVRGRMVSGLRRNNSDRIELHTSETSRPVSVDGGRNVFLDKELRGGIGIGKKVSHRPRPEIRRVGEISSLVSNQASSDSSLKSLSMSLSLDLDDDSIVRRPSGGAEENEEKELQRDAKKLAFTESGAHSKPERNIPVSRLGCIAVHADPSRYKDPVRSVFNRSRAGASPEIGSHRSSLAGEGRLTRCDLRLVGSVWPALRKGTESVQVYKADIYRVQPMGVWDDHYCRCRGPYVPRILRASVVQHH